MRIVRQRHAADRLQIERLEGRAVLAIDAVLPSVDGGQPDPDAAPDPDQAFVTELPMVDVPQAPSFSAGYDESDAGQPWIASATAVASIDGLVFGGPGAAATAEAPEEQETGLVMETTSAVDGPGDMETSLPPFADGSADSGQPPALAWLRGQGDQAPAPPAVRLAHDTGLNADDRITRRGRLVVETAPGFRAGYSTDGGVTWRRSFRAHPGVNVVLVRQVERDGPASPAASFEFTLDRRRPAAPRLGLSAGDALPVVVATRQGSLGVSGVEAGGRVEYSVNGRAWNPTFVPIDGMNSIRVRQVDMAGNASRPGVPVAVWRVFAADRSMRTESPQFTLRPRWRRA